MATQTDYGRTQNGEQVYQFTLTNKNGVEVRCINYGCRLTHFFAPAPGGEIADILLGYDNLAGYEADTASHGAFIGRYANRIKGAAFTIEGKTYNLLKNNGGNYLHGSLRNRVFSAEIIGENSVSFTYLSPDGEDGFPGELRVTVIYTLTDQNELMMDYRAFSSAATHVNFTNHSYFNLAGEGTPSMENQLLWLNSKTFLEEDSELCPTGNIIEVAGGALDFTQEKPIGRDIEADDPQIKGAGGYDHAFILNKDTPRELVLAAIARHPETGRSLRVYTTQPSMQFYTGNFLTGQPGKNGHTYPRRSAFCLETQHYPSSPGHPHFPSTLLLKGEKIHEITVYQIGG
ncbi:galactose mutarotase [Ruminococcaceae bacterium OttesenSCG-928-A16]|nr:galactose mutarotase [Ruminococcaceae bacterium OttesenSCG-928-A16]